MKLCTEPGPNLAHGLTQKDWRGKGLGTDVNGSQEVDSKEQPRAGEHPAVICAYGPDEQTGVKGGGGVCMDLESGSWKNSFLWFSPEDQSKTCNCRWYWEPQILERVQAMNVYLVSGDLCPLMAFVPLADSLGLFDAERWVSASMVGSMNIRMNWF